MNDQFDWPLAFDAEKFLRQRMDSFLERNSFARQLAGRMREETGTDFLNGLIIWFCRQKMNSRCGRLA